MLVMGSVSFAGTTPSPSPIAPDNSFNETKAFAGLNWKIGKSLVPQLTLGVAHAQGTNEGHVQGGKFLVNIGLESLGDDIQFKASYLNGNTDIQGEVGVGYDLDTHSLLGFGGVNGAHVAGGIDVGMDKTITPYLG
ncbi:hypothetical protein E1162_00110, partial [Rhodobacteraceae bacterium RKSG542]|uniref:hypothetical protein n=1 Tax=Pseudovibrio flavus TaxID=2529854 RepID=UPI0012BCCECD